jgi:hypothetical protein
MGMRFFVLWFCFAAGLAGAAAVPLGVKPSGGAVPLAFPGEQSFALSVTNAADWLDGTAIRIRLVWPTNAPVWSGSMVWLKDRDNFWHQYVTPGHLAGGTNDLVIPFAPGAAGWETPGHSLAWHHRVRLNPQSVGFRVFADSAFTGTCSLVSAALETAPPQGPPQISRVRLLTSSPRVLELAEARFDLPDRYANPFDPDAIDAGATVITPSGATNSVTAFYYQSYYRLEDELGEPVEPEGQPEWRVRYCPREPGVYKVSLHARDPLGVYAVTNAFTFTAAPAAPDALRFIRVSGRDRRYFETDDGALYYPIGHNTRSADDERMDDKFPWIFRKAKGPTAYRDYFRKMHDAGENWAEVWMSAWSLGLEWTEGIGGYHGAGDYHTGNAWELDRVLETAAANRIRVNLVLNYHGRMSSWCDPEWHLHPYNKTTPGGWLTMPLEFFSDPRAVAMQKRFARYTQARWGWDPVIFGYELCSELNLTGHESHHRTNFLPPVVEWCKVISEYVKSIDPNQHLVSVHVSNDYNFLNPGHCNLPTLDFNPLDAYHHTQPERIVHLIAETADAGLQFNKPILITEFGGSPMAAGREHLMIEQHAAIWTGACVPLAGVPMFWWWQVVDENNLYPRYTAVARFLEGVDPRDPAAKRIEPPVSGNDQYRALGTASPDAVRCYIHPVTYPRKGAQIPEAQHVTVTLSGLKPGIFRVEFFETEKGTATRKLDLKAEGNGVLAIPVPPFRVDCAFKARLVAASSK